MNDLIPISLFLGCLLATFGLVRACEWLRPVSPSRRLDQPGTRNIVATQRENGQ